MDIKERDDIGGLHSRKRSGKGKWIALVVALLVLTNIGSFFLGSISPVALTGSMTSNGQLSKAMEGIKDVDKFKKLFQMREVLYKLYDGEIDDNLMLEGAIKGMTASLNDPYTVFMNQKEFSDLMEKNEGNYVGLGIQVGAKDNKIVVISVFENSPASKAGVQTGDIIEKVNDTEVSGNEMDKAVSMMKGKEKTDVKVTLYRENKGSFDLTMKRDTITMVTVKGEMLENSIGYIQITMFDEHTGDEFNKKLAELKGKGMKALVLDLRSNPGGLLEECTKVVSNFIPKGKLIVSTKDKYGKEEKYNSVGGAAIGMPLVALTDEGTASASEIVSGAIRDYKIGTLVGEKTFGKGIVQRVLDLKDGTGLKVTVSKYYTPNGENIHKVGISPDIEVKLSDELRQSYSRAKDPQFSKALEILREKVK